jgi:hypothetical protein
MALLGSRSSDDDKVKATIARTGRKDVPGVMEELGLDGVTIVSPAKAAADVETGDRVSLVLEGQAVGGRHEAPGHVESVREVRGVFRISVRYVDSKDYDALIEAGAGRSFNRRSAYRVNPATVQPVRVTVEDPAGSWRHETTAADLSATGTAFLLDPAPAKDVDGAPVLRLSLAFPGSREPARLAARVRFRKEVEGRVRFGVDFDRTETEAFDDEADRVVLYIMRRQREQLREQRTAR